MPDAGTCVAVYVSDALLRVSLLTAGGAIILDRISDPLCC